VKFCPKCERRMKPKIEEGILSCPKCGLIVEREEEKTLVKGNLIRNADSSSQSSLKILEAEKGLVALTATTIDCP
jgi:DNA-directed RNA polymerase subunit M